MSIGFQALASAVPQPNRCGVMSLMGSGNAFSVAALPNASQLKSRMNSAAATLRNLPNVVENIVQNDVDALASQLENMAGGAINTLISHMTAHLTNMVTNLTLAAAQSDAQAKLASSGCGLPSNPPTQSDPCGNIESLFGSVMGLGSTLVDNAVESIGSLTSTITGLSSGTLTDITAALGAAGVAIANVEQTAAQMTSMVAAEVAAQGAMLNDLILHTASDQLTSLIGHPCASSVLNSIATDALLQHLRSFVNGSGSTPPWADPPQDPPATITDLTSSNPGVVFGIDNDAASVPIGSPPTSDSITLTWTNPTTGTPPFFYQVQYRIAGLNAFVDYGPRLENVTFETISNLQANTTYDFRIIITNAYGTSTSSVATVATISALSGAPTALIHLTATSSDLNSVGLSWTPPGGVVPFTYQVRYRPSGALLWTNFGDPIGDTICTVTGLSSAALYDFSVVTRNSIATSTSAAISAATIGYIAPTKAMSISAAGSAFGSARATAFSGITHIGRGTATGHATATASSNFTRPQAPLLPVGPLYTSGSQITDSDGNPIRICAVTWMGAHNRHAAPNGLSQVNYKTLINSVLTAGFNCIRIATCDAAILNNDTVSNTVDYTQNPELSGLTIQSVLIAIVNYCGAVGMKVIIDSHNNDGGQIKQPNGLWYDVGGTSNGTDGSSTVGSITDATFVSVWRIRASLFKAKQAVIGYEIRNRPQGTVCTWGDNGTNDLRALYQRVGAAIQAIDSNPLIICSGPQNATSNYASSGIAPEGDLTRVSSTPVALPVANKVVYAVYCYPNTISGLSVTDSGRAYITRLQSIWGGLISNNTAPVWVAECGAGMRSDDEINWGTTFIQFINGAAVGGPSFTRPNQQIGFAWFDLEVLTGTGSGQKGLLTGWSPPSFDGVQETYWSPSLYSAAALPTFRTAAGSSSGMSTVTGHS